MKIQRPIWHVLLTLLIVSSSALFLAGQDASSGKYIVDNGKRVEMTTTYQGAPTSYTRRGNDDFSVAYFVKDGAIVKKYSLLADQGGPVSKLNLNLQAVGEGFDAVIATGKGTDLTVTGSVSASDNGDGSKDSDFSGLGAQFLAIDYAKVHIDSMKIDTKGFVRAAFIADNHAQILVTNSQVTVLGANPLTQTYKGYVNSANQNIMVSPPWVLGIQGGARGANMLGDKPTLSVVDSQVTSGGWAILSTDAGNDFMMNVVDTDLIMLPASQGGMSAGKFAYGKNYGTGYGTYLIGNATENFYGITYNGVTYAAIFTGGTATYKSSKGQIQLKDADGKDIETIAGKGRVSTINGVFGFMNHGQASLNVLDGTVVNAEEAVFLAKGGGATYTADDAVLNSNSGVLLQMIDNDDRTVGGSADGFKTELKEAAGWPSENGNVTKTSAGAPGGMGGPGGSPSGMSAADGPGGPSAAGGPPSAGGSGGPPSGASASGGPGGAGGTGGAGGAGGPGRRGGAGGPGGGGAAKLVLTNGNYKGNVYDGSGYYNQSANNVEVTVGKGATLTGAISLTETRHVDETGKQNTHFTINEYYYLGHVANRNYRNGHATAAVTLKDGGVWKVTGESLISKLVLNGGSIQGANGAGVVMKIGGKVTTIQPGKTYSGDIVIAPSAAKVGL